MMTKKVFLVLTFHLGLIMQASADHRGDRALDWLARSAANLSMTTQQSWLDYQVKMTVLRFNRKVQSLIHCRYGNGGPDFGEGPIDDEREGEIFPPPRHGHSYRNHISEIELFDSINKDHRLPFPELDQCRYILEKVYRSFMPVERYLYDTYADFPYVYRAYMETRRALQEVRLY